MRRRRYPAIVRGVAACAFCDSGAQISLGDIAAALDADRGAGFYDPTPERLDELAVLLIRKQAL